MNHVTCFLMTRSSWCFMVCGGRGPPIPGLVMSPLASAKTGNYPSGSQAPLALTSNSLRLGEVRTRDVV